MIQVVTAVFNRPGLGKLLLGAINQRDYTLIQSGLMAFAAIVVIVDLIVDPTYSLLDPRVKIEVQNPKQT